MDALSVISDSNMRRHHYRGFHSRSSSKKSVETGSLRDVSLPGHRTASLTTLSTSSNNNYDTDSPVSTDSRSPVIRNVGRLETLEAKMATIESSLSRTKRPVPDDMWQNLPKGAREVVREIEMLRRGLKEKDVLITRLRSHLAQLCSEPTDMGSELNIEDKRRLEERLKTLRRDVDCRQISLKKMRNLLERLKEPTNIDVRIQRAELECQLEKEELNILNVELEAKNIEKRLQDSARATALANSLKLQQDGKANGNCSSPTDNNRTGRMFGNLFPAQPTDDSSHQCLALLRIRVKHDPDSRTFELTDDTGDENNATGRVVIERADPETRLEKGDRILEINGRTVMEDCAEEIRSDILAVLKPEERVELVVARELTADHIFEAKKLREDLAAVVDTLKGKLKENQDLSTIINKYQKEKDNLKTESQRMAHRISYLEDQVGELEKAVKVQNKDTPSVHEKTGTSVTLGSAAKPQEPPVQVYQRGSNVATVTVNAPAWETPVKASNGKSKSSKSSKSAGGKEPPAIKEKPMQLLQNASRFDFFRSIGPKSGGYYVSSAAAANSSSSVTGVPIHTSSAASEVSFSDAEHSRPHYHVKNKPAPPKKPDRLHLYRATSVQSVDAIDSHNGRKRKHNRPSCPPEHMSAAASDVGAPISTPPSGLMNREAMMSSPYHHSHGHHHHSVSGSKSSSISQKWPSLQGFRLRQTMESPTVTPEATQKARVQWC